jgi:hypothetical protein
MAKQSNSSDYEDSRPVKKAAPAPAPVQTVAIPEYNPFGPNDMFGTNISQVGAAPAGVVVAPGTTENPAFNPAGTVAMDNPSAGNVPTAQLQKILALEKELEKAKAESASIGEMKGRATAEKAKWSDLALQYANERQNVGTSAPIVKLQEAMDGKTPSAAEAMLKDQANTITKQTMGQAYSRSNNPAVTRAAIMAGAEAQQTAVSQTAVIRAQEQAQARSQWADAYMRQQAQLAQQQLSAMGGAFNAEELYQRALGTQTQVDMAERQKQFEVQMSDLNYERQKEMARIGQEYQDAQTRAARDESLIPSMFQGAIGGAAAGGAVGGPWGALGGAAIGAGGAYMTNKNSTTSAPSYGYGQFATTAGSAAMAYANKPKAAGGTETALTNNGATYAGSGQPTTKNIA